jgi:hypothetical protein
VAAVNPDVFTETLTAPGVFPNPGVTDSHWPPDVTVAINASPEPPLMLTVCACGVVPPIEYVKLSEEGLGLIVGVVEATAVTLTVCEGAPLAEMVTVPL